MEKQNPHGHRTSTRRHSRGWKSRNSSPLSVDGQVFFLTSPFIEQAIALKTLGERMRSEIRVESRTGAVALVSRWRVDCAFAPSPQSGLAWFCFLFPLIEPDRRISRIRLSEKTHTEFPLGM